MSKTVKHVLWAIGGGVAAALALIPATGEINWRIVGVAFGTVTLSALGVGVSARRDKDAG